MNSLLTVPLGTTGAAFRVEPGMSICAGPAVLSGTVLVETAPTPDGPWATWRYGTISQAGSFRPEVSQWARVTAATKNATVIVTDLNDRKPIVVSGVLATASSTAEQTMYSLRLPPRYLPPVFSLSIRGSVSTTNAAHVKTIDVKVGGTSILTSPDLQSLLNYNFLATCVGDGGTIKGFGVGEHGGVGSSSTAYSALVADWQNSELEIKVTGTKATAAETLQIDSLVITIN